MDSVLRKMIREQLKEQGRDREKHDEEAGSSSGNTTAFRKADASKKAKAETRLTGLLNKINRRDDKKETTTKLKKAHIKWKRFCPFKREFKLVRADNDGGIRLLELPFNMDLSVGELMNMAISLYFTEVTGINKFSETIEECIFGIVFSKWGRCSETTKFWPYIRDNGLVI